MTVATLPLPLFWISVLTPPSLAIVLTILRGSGITVTRILAYVSALLLITPGLIVSYYLYIGRYEAVRDPLVLNLREHGFGAIGLAIDHLSAPILLGVSIVTALVSIYSIRYITHRIAEMESEGYHAPSPMVYYTLYLGFSSAMLGVVMSNNLISIYVFLELSLITSFLLIALYGYGERVQISLLYFVWTHISSALILLGILYCGFKAACFELIDAYNVTYTEIASRVMDDNVALIVPISLTLGLLIKLAAFGVHVWLPYAHAEAPTPVSALLSPNMVGLAGYLLARLGLSMYPGFLEDSRPLLMVLALASILFGGLLAHLENDIKRLLAYSSVSQMGYILLGISTLSDLGVAGAMLHYLTHAIGKAILFMIAGVLIVELHGARRISDTGGLAKIYPITAGLAIYGFMHLLGMPPAMGLWSKVLIFFGIVKAYHQNPLLLVVIGMATAICFLVTIFYATTAVISIFFGELRLHIESRERIDELKLPILAMTVIGLILFIASLYMSSDLVRASAELLEIGGVSR